MEKIYRGEKMEKSALFINKLNEDTEFASALVVATQTAVTKEENIAATTKFANEAGFEVSSEELQKYVESIQNPSNELSDDDLNNVAGGSGGIVGGPGGMNPGAMVGPGGTKAIVGYAGMTPEQMALHVGSMVGHKTVGVGAIGATVGVGSPGVIVGPGGTNPFGGW